MANRECNGYWFRVGADLYYECFWDGTLLKNHDPLIMQGTKCPHCERKIDGSSFGNVPIVTKVVRQAQLPTGRTITFDSEVYPGKGPWLDDE